jgi:PPM family protein phosphatase
LFAGGVVETNVFGLTDVGLVRSHNEDSILLVPKLKLYALADGMGGHLAGEVASGMVLETLQDYLEKTAKGLVPPVGDDDPLFSESANLLASGVRFANRAVFEAASGKPELRGMGTTIVAVMIVDNRAVIAHVGDSRAYLFRGGKLKQLTSDHSWIEEQVRSGLMSREEAMVATGRNMLTRAIGQEEQVLVDLKELPLKDGDCLMLCSDGLFGMVNDKEIESVLDGYRDPEIACRELLSYANGMGGGDNISIVVVSIKMDSAIMSGMKRLFSRS